MQFETLGDPASPAVLFFHAMGVGGASSRPVAAKLSAHYFCILPTSTVYCAGETYRGKAEELRQIEDFLAQKGVRRIALVVASSLGADLATAFLAKTSLPVPHAYFDGGQFAQLGPWTRRLMAPCLYLALKSILWSRGKTLRYILWCDDEAIRPYFFAAERALTYRNLRRQLADSLEDRPFPPLPETLQAGSFWAFGSAEEHFRYRPAVMTAYPHGHFPVWEGYAHMYYQLRQPAGFAALLSSIIERGCLPKLPHLRDSDNGDI